MFGCDITNLEYLIYSDLKNLIKKKRKKNAEGEISALK